MNFRIRGLEARQFDHLFALSDAELAAHGAIRRIADGPRPCRISLSDAKPGDELILVNYEHHSVTSPYRMRVCDLHSPRRGNIRCHRGGAGAASQTHTRRARL
jgi:hypothetical protein